MANNRPVVPQAIYLGDGAYARRGDTVDAVVIYASDGETESNHLYLGISEMQTLFARYKKIQMEMQG